MRDYHSGAGEEFTCEICYQTFKTKGMLINHRSAKHRDV